MATQTQTQSSSIWNDLESQPMEPIVWGRLYNKNLKLTSLGIRKFCKLIVQKSSQLIDLCQPSFTAGRATTNTFNINVDKLPEAMVSRISKVHFEITRNLDEPFNPAYLVDHSRNGTFVNGVLIGFKNQIILTDDDVISLAHPNYKAFVFKDLSPRTLHEVPEQIKRNYYISKELGKGACGTVYLIYDKKTCVEYAMKLVIKNVTLMNKDKEKINDAERVMNEVRIMKALHHPCVIKMHDIVDCQNAVYMVLEMMRGGDLISRIEAKTRLSEPSSKLLFLQICHAVKYLHDKGITHRDIKPDNILLATKDDETLVKVSDFGLSKFVAKGSIMKTLCGTPYYLAPEVLSTKGEGTYNKKVDIWSLGVVLYACLSGQLPFMNEQNVFSKSRMMRGAFSFNMPIWKEISPQAKLLIMECLTVNPKDRPNINAILSHRWLRDSAVITRASQLMHIPIPMPDGIKKKRTDDEVDENCKPKVKRSRR